MDPVEENHSLRAYGFKQQAGGWTLTFKSRSDLLHENYLDMYDEAFLQSSNL